MKVLGVWEKSFEGVSGGHEVRLMVFVSEVNIRTTPVNKTLSLDCYRKYKTGAALRSGGDECGRSRLQPCTFTTTTTTKYKTTPKEQSEV